MFWSKKGKNTEKRQGGASTKGDAPAGYGSGDSKNKGSQRSAAIRAEALANARAARERVGEETIQKIAEALIKQQQFQKKSPLDEAKARIDRANSDRVADEIRFMLDDKSKK